MKGRRNLKEGETYEHRSWDVFSGGAARRNGCRSGTCRLCSESRDGRHWRKRCSRQGTRGIRPLLPPSSRLVSRELGRGGRGHPWSVPVPRASTPPSVQSQRATRCLAERKHVELNGNRSTRRCALEHGGHKAAEDANRCPEYPRYDDSHPEYVMIQQQTGDPDSCARYAGGSPKCIDRMNEAGAKWVPITRSLPSACWSGRSCPSPPTAST